MNRPTDASVAALRCCLLVILLAAAAPAAISFAAAPWSTAPPLLREPAQPVRMCAEWEPAYGTLIRWPLGIPADLVVELARDDSLYVLVETSGQESQARNSFANWGIDLSVVRFIHTNTYSHWTRDWGPHSVFDGDGVYGITDPVFDGYPWVSGCIMDRLGAMMLSASVRLSRLGSRRSGGPRGWEEDDAVNAALASEFGCPRHALPAYCTGGNIMTDGQGGAFSTRRMVNENHGLWNEEQFRQLARDYLGIDTYRFLDDPEVYGIQHIDCYAKLLDEETILIKQVPAWHPEYDCIERLVDQVTATTNCYGRPYRIVRIYCGTYEGDAAAGYTNSLILNGKVLVPLFNIPWDSAALATYAEAMPGYEVVGFPWDAWYDYDALHCRTMAIFDRHMLRVAHRPLNAEVPLAPEHEIAAMIDDRSEMGLIPGQLQLFWRAQGETEWQAETLVQTAGADSFAATIPWQPADAIIEYFLSAADSSGRAETLPRTAPDGHFQFRIIGDPQGMPAPSAEELVGQASDLRLAAEPNPFISGTTIAWSARLPGALMLRIYDATGRRVRDLPRVRAVASTGTFLWDGHDDRGRACPAGLYWVRECGPAQSAGIRILRLR